ncbi:helix-turn-helix domain-containing protein [Fructilactobacillus myrtifloralis]|uniref:Helix-turn-helix domain-containing protein n=1 Tax=Fructilactobacillus myrtifloralis TaxID=2940301 RepID=A0ABY5BNY9_9LACO|nr:helix-turn-helix domain-containing protein [Fructilactobacillus myrtifloralis]USS85377.1 helix-turn-helix domain-containing protein [Fructilactobacillus myrtifloralis]
MLTIEQALALVLLAEKQPRRHRSLTNLVRGKRTVATLYWGFRYQWLGVLGIGRYLAIQELPFASLRHQQLVAVDHEQDYLTPAGLNQQQLLFQQLPLQWQAEFQTTDLQRLKSRLLLLTQVISEFNHHENHYFAVRTPMRERVWVKNYFFQLVHTNRLAEFQSDLTAFLAALPTQTAQVVSHELVGYHNNGWTREQIAQALRLNPLAVAFIELAALAQLVRWNRNKPAGTLAPLSQGLQRDLITKKARQTLQLYQTSHDVKRVAAQQHIKPSTVDEHLLENAIYVPLAQFPYSDFVSQKEVQRLVRQYGNNVDDWQFQPDQEAGLSFFQFRLIQIWLTKLARKEAGHGSANATVTE